MRFHRLGIVPFEKGAPNPGKTFERGRSGNPGGRPSIAKAWDAATGGKKAADVGAEALKLAYTVAMAGPTCLRDSNWQFAMTQVLHYSLGKPKEQIAVTGDVSPEAQALLAALRLTPHERRQLAAQDSTAAEDDAAMDDLVGADGAVSE